MSDNGLYVAQCTALIVRPIDDSRYSEQSVYEYLDLLKRYDYNLYDSLTHWSFKSAHNLVIKKLGRLSSMAYPVLRAIASKK